MPTTTNFGWTTPADTDLVKDGAAAIRTALGGVDTSFVDLKGGTSGQVLSKASNTDLDFTWTTPFDSELSINAQTGTTYTFVLDDGNDKLVTASNASAQTYSIPTNASVAFPIGTVINIIAIGAGQVTINAVTPGTTTVLSTAATAASPKLRVQYSAASCIKVATDTWYVVGDIA
jgi:hypothetical protein